MIQLQPLLLLLLFLLLPSLLLLSLLSLLVEQARERLAFSRATVSDQDGHSLVCAASLCHAQADIWSLGITACEMAKGYPPYANLTAMQVLMKTMRDKPPTLKDYPVMVPCGCQRRALMAVPVHRSLWVVSCRVVSRRLTALTCGCHSCVHVCRTRRRRRSPRRSSRSWRTA